MKYFGKRKKGKGRLFKDLKISKSLPFPFQFPKNFSWKIKSKYVK